MDLCWRWLAILVKELLSQKTRGKLKFSFHGKRRRRRIHSEKFFLSRQMNLGKLNGQFGGGSASPFQITFIARNVKENFRKCKTCQKVIMEIDIHPLWL